MAIVESYVFAIEYVLFNDPDLHFQGQQDVRFDSRENGESSREKCEKM